MASYFSGPIPAGSAAVNNCPQPLHRRRSISNTVAFRGACPMIRTRVFGSFWRYTFPEPHSGHGSPGWSVSCRTVTLSAPVKVLAPLRPWPFTAGLAGSASLPSRCARGCGFGNTTLVFSVVRCRSNCSAMACRAALSFRPSESLSGARRAPSIIPSNSSRFTSMRDRDELLFMTDSVTRESVGSAGSQALP